MVDSRIDSQAGIQPKYPADVGGMVGGGLRTEETLVDDHNQGPMGLQIRYAS